MWEKASFLFLLLAILYSVFGISIMLYGIHHRKRELDYLSIGFFIRSIFYLLPGLLFFDINIVWGVWIVGPLKVSLLPFLFLFLQKLDKKDKKLNRADYWHFMPLIFCLVITLVAILGHTTQAVNQDKITARETMQLIWQGKIIFNSVFIPAKVVSFLQFIAYTILYIDIYKKRVRQISEQTSQSKFTKQITKLIIVMFITYSFAEGIGVFGIFTNAIPFLILVIFHVIFVFFISILIMSRYNALQILEAKVKEEPEKENTEKVKTESRKVIEKFKNEKLYLLNDISLNKVAFQLSIPQYKLTQIIKDEGYANFYSFINYYRIERSKELLSQMPDNYVIEAIIKDSGFNSRSTFFRVFKEVTGETPLQFFNKNKE